MAKKGEKHKPETIEKIRKSNLGKKRSLETRKRISESLIGTKRCLGIKRSEETKKKMSESKKGQGKGEKRSEEWKRKISESHKGKIQKSPSLETRIKMSRSHSGENNHFYGRIHTEETKLKMSKKAKERVLSDNMTIVPNFNKEACELFDLLNEETKTNGVHALNGGEKRIKSYYVDYFNSKLKMIIEWDEKAHYKVNGELKKQDIKRQNYIMKQFPDYKFIRIKGF